MLEVIAKLKAKLLLSDEQIQKILDKVIEGGESSASDLAKWYSERFEPNLVSIDEAGYSEMCINALKILKTTAATDYGSSRQRDMGQLWADMTRGYLGEYAFKIFLEKRFQTQVELGHQKGDLQEFLPTDIHSIVRPNGKKEKLNKTVSIKTSKWNGIWLDIPNAQFNHSDYHVFVKIGADRDHLFSFFKQLSVFKDKILKRGEEIGSLTKEQSIEIFDSIPSFTPIPAYICGFAKKSDSFNPLSYSGKKGRKNFTITGWCGPISSTDLSEIKNRESILGKVSFSGIGEFSHDSGYLFNTGNLHWMQSDWENLTKSL